jgi:hypothetical protein
MNSDPAKQAWQASVEIAGAPPLDEVRKGADKFYRVIRRRNAIEYVACVVVIAVFTTYLFTLPHVLHKVGSAMVVAAAIFGPWQLHRRASAVAPAMAGAMPIYDFLRGQLVRQRDALKGIFWWYILPFLPGIALVIAGNGLHPETEAAGPPIWARWAALAGMVSIIGFIWWLNQVVARKLQRRIDEIDALTGRAQ